MQWVCPSLFKSWTLKVFAYAYESLLAQWNYAKDGAYTRRECDNCETTFIGGWVRCYACQKNQGVSRAILERPPVIELARERGSYADEWFRKMTLWIWFIHPRIRYYTGSCNSIERANPFTQCGGCDSWVKKGKELCSRCNNSTVQCDLEWCKGRLCSACNVNVCEACSVECSVPGPERHEYCNATTCQACYDIYKCTNDSHDGHYCFAHELARKPLVVRDEGLQMLCIESEHYPGSGCYEHYLTVKNFAREPKRRKIEFEEEV